MISAQVAAELAERSTVGGFSAPWPFAQAVIALLDASVRERAGVTLDELRPVARATDNMVGGKDLFYNGV